MTQQWLFSIWKRIINIHKDIKFWQKHYHWSLWQNIRTWLLWQSFLIGQIIAVIWQNIMNIHKHSFIWPLCHLFFFTMVMLLSRLMAGCVYMILIVWKWAETRDVILSGNGTGLAVLWTDLKIGEMDLKKAFIIMVECT